MSAVEISRRRLRPDVAVDAAEPVQAPPTPVLPVAVPLAVGAADDPAEASADRMADSALGRLRSAAPGGPAAPADSAASADDHRHGPGCAHVRRSALPGPVGAAGGDLDAGTTATINARVGGGRPLPDPVRSRMEAGFSRSFADVRIHDDAPAAGLNRTLSARAFTAGRDIFFGAGEYAPESPSGEQVLAHELAHVVQDGGGVRRWPGGKKKKKGADPGGPDAADPGDATTAATTTAVLDPMQTPGNEGLATTSTTAFAVAVPLDANYAEPRDAVAAWVPRADQEKITEVASVLQRSKGDADKRTLKDLLRAFILSQYVQVIAQKIPTPLTDAGAPRALTEAERKLVKTRYLPKTLQNRDKWAGLIEKGPYSPETQTWLEQAGFGAAITRTPQQKAADGGGPRLDVRATFIGGEVLGAPRRMHLFLVYTTSDGEQMYFRGGPDEDDCTVCDFGRYEATTIDWDPAAPSVTVAKGEKAQLLLDKLTQAAASIDGLKVPYVGSKANLNAGGLGGLEAFVNGENCNAVAWTLLDRAGAPKKKPSGVHPGWGHTIGEYLKGGAAKLPPKETDVGSPALLAGGPTDQVEVYADRERKELLLKLAGGTAIQLVRAVDNGMTKILFGPKGKPGFVDGAAVHKPPKAGRKFWVTGKANSFQPIHGTTGFADAGTEITVLDPSFVVGSDVMVDVQYNDKYGGQYEGQISGKVLTDVDPAAAVRASEASSSSSSEEESGSGSEAESGGVAKSGDAAPTDARGGAVAGPDKAVGAKGKAAANQPAARPAVVKAPVEESESESDEDAKPPVIAEFTTTVGNVMVFNADGSQHRFKGVMAKPDTAFGATGKFKDLVDGRRMCQLVVHDHIVWLDDRKFKATFGQDYPAT